MPKPLPLLNIAAGSICSVGFLGGMASGHLVYAGAELMFAVVNFLYVYAASVASTETVVQEIPFTYNHANQHS